MGDDQLKLERNDKGVESVDWLVTGHGASGENWTCVYTLGADSTEEEAKAAFIDEMKEEGFLQDHPDDACPSVQIELLVVVNWNKRRIEFRDVR